MRSRSFTVAVPFFATVAMVFFLITASTLDILKILLVNVLTLSALEKSVKPITQMVILCSFFVIPLFIIHGFLNQQFELSGQIMSVNYRGAGLEYALKIASKISLYVSIALFWLNLIADDFIDLLIRLKLPIVLIAIISQAVSIANLIPEIARQILKAQQSRGIITGPGYLNRIKTLPKIIIPLASRLLTDIEPRSIALVSRGFMHSKMSNANTLYYSSKDILTITFLFFIYAIIIAT